MVIKELTRYKFFDNYFNLYEEIMLKSKLKENIIKL